MEQRIGAKKLACAYFFALPAIAYGTLTSRLPAFKELLNADDGQIGLMMLALGCSTLVGLLLCGFLVNRYGSRLITALAGLLLGFTMIAASFASSYWQMTGCCLLAGIFVGLCDVGMNAQGIFLEQRYGIFCLAFLHACSSIGGVVGSLGGSLFAALRLTPFINFVVVMGAYLLFWPIAFAYMARDNEPATTVGNKSPLARPQRRLFWGPVLIFVGTCALLSLICHVVEGAAAEWGSVLLAQIKHASQEVAALVFAFFTGAMLIFRLFSDRLRSRISSFHLLLYGSLLGAAGMAVVLLSPWPFLCLAGYAIMGAGVAPIVPLLFSLAGAAPGVTPGYASGIVSVFSYAGLLFFPPFIGMLGEEFGLEKTLWVIVLLCVALAFGALALRRVPEA